jgi:hypothetical protein
MVRLDLRVTRAGKAGRAGRVAKARRVARVGRAMPATLGPMECRATKAVRDLRVRQV